MEINQQSQSAIESAIKKAIKPFIQGSAQPTVTAIHIQPNFSSGELSIFDDEDNELASTTVREWINCDSDDYYEEGEKTLRFILNKLKDENTFSNLTILKPYSFVLLD